MPERIHAPRVGAEMSRRERETLMLLTKGYSSVAIAQRLNVTPSYIYSIVRMLKIRFDATTNTGIVVRAIAEGVITPDGELAE